MLRQPSCTNISQVLQWRDYTYTKPRAADHRRLSKGDTRSVMMRSESTNTPPAPIPCTVRPNNAVLISPAIAVTSEPMIKRVSPVSNMDLRPKISAKAENIGMTAVAATRKEIPSQKVLTDGPWSATAIVCRELAIVAMLGCARTYRQSNRYRGCIPSHHEVDQGQTNACSIESPVDLQRNSPEVPDLFLQLRSAL
jgi:hypothetical protein